MSLDDPSRRNESVSQDVSRPRGNYKNLPSLLVSWTHGNFQNFISVVVVSYISFVSNSEDKAETESRLVILRRNN